MAVGHNELTRVQLPAVLHLMRLGYDFLSSKSAAIQDRDKETNILVPIFQEQFLKLNSYATEEDVQRELANIRLELDENDLGRAFFKRLQGSSEAQLVDWERPERNSYHVAMEVTAQNGEEEFRPDIVLFINGLPLAYIEVKQPDAVRDGKTGIDSEKARTRARFENRKFRRFNNLTQLIAISDNLPYDSSGSQMRQGSYYTTNAFSKPYFNSFKEEREAELQGHLEPLSEQDIDLVLGDVNRIGLKQTPEFATNLAANTPCNSFLTSLFSRDRILFFLRFGLTYVEDKKADGQLDLQKHIMRYPQYFANQAIGEAVSQGVKRGVIWHTQGSGKTALSFFASRYLRDLYRKQGIVPNFYFVVDRLDLADQAEQEFTKRGLKVKRINHPSDLGRVKEGFDMSVVNIQKFKEGSDLTNQSGYDLQTQNIYFIDEAHRSYNEKGSYLPNLYNADKQAIKIALTGTPLITKKADGQGRESHATTRDIFGDYLHKYYYNQSIADGFTLRLMREDIETSYRDNLRDMQEQIQKGGLSKGAIFAHPNYVSPMLDFIIDDFNRARDVLFADQSIGGMVVCDSSEQARELHQQLEARRTAGETTLTSTLILHDVGDKEERKVMTKAFKEGQGDLLIVYNMLLTGFDAPRLKRLYLGRKIKAHNLLQTLTRVNRPYKDYRFGYVVDFADISSEFDKTNRAYLEELNREYDSQLTGEDTDHVFGTIFVSAEEISQQLAQSQAVLIAYPTQNKEYFVQALRTIEDRKELLALRKALESVRENYNQARLLGYEDLLAQIDIGEIAYMLNKLSNHMMTRILIDRPDDVASRHLLNLAMQDVSFSFAKIAEEELRLLASDLDELRRRVAGGIRDFQDEKDPEWVGLMEEFRRIMTKQSIQEQAGYDKAHLQDLKGDYKKLEDRLADFKRRMNLLRLNFDGDDMAAKAFKQVTGSTQIADHLAQYQIIRQGKPAIDQIIGNNKGILTTEGFLYDTVKSQSRKAMKDSSASIDRSEFLQVVESLCDQYKGEYY